MANEEVIASGQVERLGSDAPNLIYKRPEKETLEMTIDVAGHKEALKVICDMLIDAKNGVLSSLKDVEAIGHRVVHGGEKATKPIIITEEVKAIINECASLAPLHNPPNMSGIEACENIFPGIKNIAVFDTAFHQSMEAESYLYAIPYELYEKYGIRRYGFHGTSHNFVACATAEYLNKPFEELRIITCHIGNGGSMAAIDRGKVVDTTMGLTPLEGLVMGTRCGDIDPAIIFHLNSLGMSLKEIDATLNKKSGLLGVAGIGSSDMRDIIKAKDEGNDRATQAFNMFVRRIVKYIGSYYVLLEGVDAIIFTGGIGEYSAPVRQAILERCKALDITINDDVNKACFGTTQTISAEDSAIDVIVMPTNEELMIAQSVVSTLN
jgi:acetate kinase